jgi:hypothetical protein
MKEFAVTGAVFGVGSVMYFIQSLIRRGKPSSG